MIIVLVIIAILLFFILIAIEPEALQAIGSCIGLIFGLVALIVGGVILFSYLSERTVARQSDAKEAADANRAVDEALNEVQAVLDAAAADPRGGIAKPVAADPYAGIGKPVANDTARGPWEHYQSQPDIAPDTDRAVADAMNAANDAVNYAEAATNSSDEAK